MEKELTRSKREKHSYAKFEDLAHLLAHKDGKVAYCRNGRLKDNVIYSYGYHFPIARMYTDKRGLKTVFFTTDTYGSTTAQHISSTRWACNHMNILYMLHPILVGNKEDGSIT